MIMIVCDYSLLFFFEGLTFPIEGHFFSFNGPSFLIVIHVVFNTDAMDSVPFSSSRSLVWLFFPLSH